MGQNAIFVPQLLRQNGALRTNLRRADRRRRDKKRAFVDDGKNARPALLFPRQRHRTVLGGGRLYDRRYPDRRPCLRRSRRNDRPLYLPFHSRRKQRTIPVRRLFRRAEVGDRHDRQPYVHGRRRSQILYEKLGLPGNRKGSTSVEHLQTIKHYHPIVEKILEYRKYAKQISTYIDGLIPFIGEDGKLHPTFNQALTTTGRLSCSEPNLQNISTRDEESKQIRKAFYYKEENISILSLDYSQVELRMLAHLSNSKSMINMFNSNEDIHTATAKLVFNLDREPTSLERRKAKAVNFGIVYGISDWGLSEQLEIPVLESREIIMNFYQAFPEIKEYLNRLVEEATTNGYATTMFNRRRYLPEINSDKYQLREFAKRAAMNAPIQGSASDLIKIAMIKVADALKEGNYKSKLVSQIHDELILKVYDNEKDSVYGLVKNIMENCVKLKVALKVDGGYAKNWYLAK